ncbi:MAG: signal transduction histidine kinase, with phosphoacceptor and binding domain [Nitrososphaeraceae archaeon]|nr:signal transduction histidine kinase, with phosphoacceptor and binding domain [Nitrososphaeraceae archaeon]
MMIRTKLIIIFLIISIVPLTIFGTLNYLNTEQALTKETLNKLETLATLQEKNIQNLVDQNLEKLNLVSSRLQLKVELDKYNNNNNGNKTQSQQFITRIINPVKSESKSFEDIYILSPMGQIVASINNASIGRNHSTDEFFIKGSKQNDVTIFFKDPEGNLRVYLTGPLILNDNKLVGVVSIISNLDTLLSQIQTYEGLGETGEFNLVKRDDNGDALLINPLRFDPAAALTLRVDKDDVQTPIIQALLKNEKTFTNIVDYRGVPVLAVTRHIEGVDWGLVAKIDKAEGFAALDNLRNLTILTGIIVAALVVVASLFLGQSMSLPIRKLRDAAQNIARGNFGMKIEVNSSDEIGQLANQFENMKQNIQYTNQNLNQIVYDRTKKLEEANKQLALANEQLKLNEKAQKEFINVAAHELRTPIVPILGLSELLYSQMNKNMPDDDNDKGRKQLLQPEQQEKQQQQDFLQKKKQLEKLEVIIRNASRLQRLTEDILDVTKIESQALKLRLEKANLKDLISDIIGDYTRSEIGKLKSNVKIRFEPHDKDSSILVNVDMGRIAQIISNLISNALKFTEEGSITVAIDKKISKDNNNNQVIVSVKDTGDGIDPEILPRLFTKFATKSDVGTGLGLYISKSIIEAHGGKIWAENNNNTNNNNLDEQTRRGSTFYFTLPLFSSSPP